MSRITLRSVVPVALLVATTASAARFLPSAQGDTGDSYCWHDEWVVSSEWHCPGDTSRAGLEPVNEPMRHGGPNAVMASEDSVIAYPRGGRGDRKQVIAIVPSNSDGVYISNYAVDSFLAPGLVLEGHADAAAAVRAFVGGHWHMNITHRPNEVMLACAHFDADPQWQCTDATGMDYPTLDSVTMIRHHSTTPTKRVKFPKGADALFFGRRVVEKHLVPYYQGRNPKYADSLKQAVAKTWPKKP